MYWNEFDIFHDVYKLVIVIDYFSASDSSIIFVIGLFLDNHFFSFTVKMLSEQRGGTRAASECVTDVSVLTTIFYITFVAICGKKAVGRRNIRNLRRKVINQTVNFGSVTLW